MDKKIFFCGRGPYDCPGAWAELWDLKELREHPPVAEALATAGVDPGREFGTCRIEYHNGNEDDSVVMIWGGERASFDANSYGDDEGLRVVIDGVEIHNDLIPVDGDEDDGSEEG